MNNATHKLLAGLPSERLNEIEEQMLARVITRAAASEESKQRARDTLVLHAMWESFFYARRCCRRKLPDDEIYSLSYDALCRAVKNFEPGKIRFFAYAKIYVRGAICREWKKKDVVKNSSSHESLMVEDDPWSELQRGIPSADQEWDPGEIFARRSISHQKMSEKKLVPDVQEPEFEAIQTREIWAILEPVLKSRLSKHEQLVVTMIYKDDLNFQEIGDKLNVSRNAIHITHDRAMKRLRCVLSHKKELLLGHG